MVSPLIVVIEGTLQQTPCLPLRSSIIPCDVLILIMVWGFVTCGPNEALVISGCCHKKPLLVPGGRAFVWPTVQQVQRISLNVMTLNVESPRVYTAQGVPISVTGIAQVKVQGQYEEMLLAACEQFLGKTENEIQLVALETLEGHQRAIMGSMSVEEIYKDRKKFNQNVFEVASSDLINMGITVLSYTLKDIHDDEGYLDALGMARTAEVKRDARIGEAEASKDSQIKEAIAEEERMASKYINDTEIAKAQRDFELKKASYDMEVNAKKAEAELAYELQAAKTRQKIKEEQMQIKVVERAQEVLIQDQEIQRRERELEATVKQAADAEKFKLEKLAEASRNRTMLEAEAEAEAIRVKGEAEAFSVEAKAKAEALIMQQKAEAMKEYKEAAMLEMYLATMPKVAAEVAAPLSQTKKLTMVSTGQSEVGAAKLTGEVMDIISKVPHMVKNMTGVDVTKGLTLVTKRAKRPRSLTMRRVDEDLDFSTLD
ncbi:flotillin-1 isoform X4 [Palaemon carinicauda]|uniref:flotillin-1 isoform X4 n=1 Tax=Palaemon carinicauda TaxID=392227 RepID=UPI0035B68CD8